MAGRGSFPMEQTVDDVGRMMWLILENRSLPGNFSVLGVVSGVSCN